MQCPRCQHENPPGVKFCGECAAPLAATCLSCGAANPPENKFCGHCAAPIRANDSQVRRSGLVYAEIPRREDPNLQDRPRRRTQAGDRPLLRPRRLHWPGRAHRRRKDARSRQPCPKIHARRGTDRRRRRSTRRGGGGVRRGYGHRHRVGGSGGRVRGVPAGGDGGQEGGGHRARAGPLPKVHRAPWWEHLGTEPAGRGLDVHVHVPRRQ
jgi:hypothetical protein